MLSPRNKGAGKRFREPFGKAGLTVAILALVFAMVGGAWAATGLNGKQKKEVKKIAKSFQGTGPAGAAGPAGAKGDNGSNGTNGAKGDKGDTGATGKQGIQGKEGKEGSPWTAGGTLPSGKTETGIWTLGGAASAGSTITEISFPIPLADASNLAFGFNLAKTEEIEEGTIGPSGCSGSVAEPTAPSGTLCVYTGKETALNAEVYSNYRELIPPEASIGSGAGYGVSGAVLHGGEFAPENPAEAGFWQAWGSWAVTAPPAP
jgi:hypothetical protein